MAITLQGPAAIRISPSSGEHREQTTRPASSGSRAESVAETDEALAMRAQEGSLAAFGALVDRYERRLIGFLSQRAGGTHAAEDLAQETFVRAWRRIDTFDPDRRFSTWLFTIGARLAADDYRRRKRERASAEQLGRKQAAESAEERPGGAGAPTDIWSVARRLLSAEQMEAMWLRYVMEMDIAGIAAALGRTRVGTRVMLFRARERLASAPELRETLEHSEASPRRTDGLATEVGS